MSPVWACQGQNNINILLTCSCSASEAFSCSQGGAPGAIHLRSLFVPLKETEKCRVTEDVLVRSRHLHTLQTFTYFMSVQLVRHKLSFVSNKAYLLP